jgi:VanZ family protein
MKPLRFVRYWMPAIVWMAIIFLGSTDMLSAEHTSRFLVPFLRWIDPQISFAALNAIQFGIRKLGHLTEYAILAMLLWRAFRRTFTAVSKGMLAGGIFFVSAAFAASDEFHQSFVPSRTSSAHDVMIDCIGAFVAVLLCWIFARRNPVYQASIK